MMHYERLSALDALFLDLEKDASSHMHVAAVLLFDAAPLRAAHGGLDMARIRAYLESRLHLIPRYRQRLAYIPLEHHPVWVDDARFNLFYHVRHSALPKPGEERQLKRLCGRIMSQKLDPTKPLWEVWVVEGLADDRFALIAKTHHAMVDGIAGMDLLTVALSPAPESTFAPPPPWRPRPEPTALQLLGGEFARRRAGVASLARQGLRLASEPQRVLGLARDALTGVVEYLAPGSVPAARTMLNPELGPHRRFDWVRFDLAAVKRVKEALGGTLNDVVLATVAGAARRFLGARGERLEGIDFRAMVPVSTRADAERGRTGNRVVNFVVQLPIGEPDALARYQRVIAAMQQQKTSHVAQGGELLEELADWTVTGVLTQIIDLAARRQAWNLVVTNVPGPQVPLFLLQAPLRETYPVVPLFKQQGVGIALFSYDGGLYWGFNADWDALPDLHALVEAVAAEFAALESVAERRRSAA
jgi:WS/DGAT/MGAT family acyltransferase